MLAKPPHLVQHNDTLDCSFEVQDFDDAVQSIKMGLSTESAAAHLLGIMTPREKLSMLDGDEPFWKGLRGILMDRYNRNPFVMGAIPRLKIPGIRFTDGPRGIVMHESTCFPVSMARGATWDTNLEQRIGDAIGLEGRAQGANYFAGICINLPRHPAWGRAQETYSEDPLLLGEFGAALHRGTSKHLMTCVKHFALNSMENARFKVDVQVDDAALHEVYLPHFKRLVDEGVSSVMSSYNSVRGEFAGENHELLKVILREQWGFAGFVLSDFIFGLRNAVKSIRNGLDIEAPFQQQRKQRLETALDRAELHWSEVTLSCSRILQKQLEHSLRTGADTPSPSVVFCDKHRNLAREAASRGMVLLKNDLVSGNPVLPLRAQNIQRLAIVGRLANRSNTGDRGSSAVFAPEVTTPYEGMRAAMPESEIILEDTDNVMNAEGVAALADTTLCIVGYDAADEGEYVVPSFASNPELWDLIPAAANDEDAEVERLLRGETCETEPASAQDGIVPGAGGDRQSLRLRQRDVEIINAATKVCPRVVVVVVASAAVIMEDWLPTAPTVLMAWYSGAEGGHALADVLLGKVDASGRLPFSIPTSEKHLPEFDIDASTITYDRWFGQRLLDKLGVTAQYPLGYGLSYTKFAFEDMSVSMSSTRPGPGDFIVRLRVRNTGSRTGRHVIQIYGCLKTEDFPSRVLVGFKCVDLSVQESCWVDVGCSLQPMLRWKFGRFEPAASSVRIQAARYVGDEDALEVVLSLDI